jgi:hypothetical protein
MSMRIAIALGVLVFLVTLAAAGVYLLMTHRQPGTQVNPAPLNQPEQAAPAPDMGGTK